MRPGLVILAMLMAGCSSAVSPLPAVSEPIAVSWCRSVDWAKEGWRAEAAKRWPTAIVVLCHGDELFGRWFCCPDGERPVPVEDAAETMHLCFPGREIVFVTCNPGNEDIDIPGVAYAHGLVKLFPQDCTQPGHVGRIGEFIDSGEKRFSHE